MNLYKIKFYFHNNHIEKELSNLIDKIEIKEINQFILPEYLLYRFPNYIQLIFYNN